MRHWKRIAGVRVFVLDERQRVLLVQMRDPRTGDRYWVTPGGGIEDGESAEEAAVREVLEETAVHVTIDRLLYMVDSVEPEQEQLVYTFHFLAHPVTGASAVLGHDPEYAPDQQLLRDARFFSREELAGLRRVYPTVLQGDFWDRLSCGGADPYRVRTGSESF